MLSLQPLIDKKKPINEPLTEQEKQELIKYNKDANYSYLSLLKEYLNYAETVNDLLKGYSGIKLFKV